MYVGLDPVNGTDPTGKQVVVTMERYHLHAFIRITDRNDPTRQTISRGGPSNMLGGAGPHTAIFWANGGGPIVGVGLSMFGGAYGNQLESQVSDDSVNIDGNPPMGLDVVLMNTMDMPNLSYEDAVQIAIDFGQAVDRADILYRILDQNSNSYAGTQWEVLTGTERPDHDLPGYGRDLCDKIEGPC